MMSNGHISFRVGGEALPSPNGIPLSRCQPVETSQRGSARWGDYGNHGSEARITERRRIAEELHDTFLQGFFAAHMQLQLAVGELPPDSPAKPRFSGLVQLMSRVIEQGRLTIQGLRSSDDREPSLGQAIAAVPSELGLPPSVQFRVVVEGSQRQIKPSLSGEVYRVVREAIVNAYHHSGAKNIEAEIEYRPAELRVSVRDNGCGIDPVNLQWAQKGQRGLHSMRDRAERMGARLRIWTRTALGTKVELCIPGCVAFEQSSPRS